MGHRGDLGPFGRAAPVDRLLRPRYGWMIGDQGREDIQEIDDHELLAVRNAVDAWQRLEADGAEWPVQDIVIDPEAIARLQAESDVLVTQHRSRHRLANPDDGPIETLRKALGMTRTSFGASIRLSKTSVCVAEKKQRRGVKGAGFSYETHRRLLEAHGKTIAKLGIHPKSLRSRLRIDGG